MPSFLGMDLRGHLDLLILATLRHAGPVHGYALISALRERSDGIFDLPEGTVYPALHRLEYDGLISSEWSTDAPRRRRTYRLTAAGAAAITAAAVLGVAVLVDLPLAAAQMWNMTGLWRLAAALTTLFALVDLAVVAIVHCVVHRAPATHVTV